MLFRAMAQRSSLENPNLSLTDPEAWDEAFGAGSTATSGVRVTHKTALKLSSVFRGVNLISTTVGKVPLYVYQYLPDGSKDRDKSHPSYRLLRRTACPEQWITSYTLKQTLTAHAILHGNGYAYVRRDKAGRALELIPLLPDRTYPVRANGKLYYVTAIGGAFDDEQSELRRIPADDILHIKGLGYDGLTGYSVISLATDDFGLAIGQTKFAAVFFKNSATPKIVLETPNLLSDKAWARLTKNWGSLKSGLEQAHKTAILEEGVQAKPLSISARDAQLIESRKFDLVMVSNWIGLPVHKIGGEGRTAFASLEQENQSAIDEAYDPWFVAWETEAWQKLLTEDEKEAESHEVEFLRQALIRADIGKRGAFYRTAVGAPFMTRNEVRRKENLPPVDGGDELLKPLNMTDESDEPEPDPPAVDDDVDDDDAGRTAAPPLTEPIRQLVGDTVQRMSKRLVTAAVRGREPWNDESHRSVLMEALTPVATLAGCDAGELRDTVISATKLRVTREEQDVPESVCDDIISVYFDDKEVT